VWRRAGFVGVVLEGTEKDEEADTCNLSTFHILCFWIIIAAMYCFMRCVPAYLDHS
jgi:hypothetical protein